jgi:hypothetical protein
VPPTLRATAAQRQRSDLVQSIHELSNRDILDTNSQFSEVLWAIKVPYLKSLDGDPLEHVAGSRARFDAVIQLPHTSFARNT